VGGAELQLYPCEKLTIETAGICHLSMQMVVWKVAVAASRLEDRPQEVAWASISTAQNLSSLLHCSLR